MRSMKYVLLETVIGQLLQTSFTIKPPPMVVATVIRGVKRDSSSPKRMTHLDEINDFLTTVKKQK